jgi:hypothetical protein
MLAHDGGDCAGDSVDLVFWWFRIGFLETVGETLVWCSQYFLATWKTQWFWEEFFGYSWRCS